MIEYIIIVLFICFMIGYVIINQIQTNNNKKNSEQNLKQMEEKINLLIVNSGSIAEKVTMLNYKEEVFEEKIKGISDILVPQGESINKNISSQLATFKEMQTNLLEVAKQTQQVQTISEQIKGLEKIFVNKNERGVFGEVQLKNILEAILGNNRQLFEMQYQLQLENQSYVRVDAIVFVPNPVGKIPIDSKFPLEAYLASDNKRFGNDVKKHINDIASKYIIPSQNITQAIMFIPAESIYNELVQNNYEIIEFAQKQNVWICSPTTLIAVLNIVQVMFVHKEQINNFDKINEQLNKLAVEFNRFEDRWVKYNNDIAKVVKDAKEIETTTRKIISQFKKITKVENE